MFGQLVGEYRRRAGLTQEELAARTGVSARTIRELEAGRVTAPRQASARRLADGFGLDGASRARFFRAASGAGLPPIGAAGPVTPAQLPTEVAGFTGRAAELDRLDALLAADGRSTAVICAVAGTAGVGKTALAVRWAHRRRKRFPDGQLYLDLRGYDPDRPVDPGEALTRLLSALGVPMDEIPVGLDERAAAYRTRLANRRMLVLLDNAGTVEQARPLLPGAGRCVVLVTSRDSMPGLVAREGAHRLVLDPLPGADATALLRRLVGPRVDTEPAAAAELVSRCAGLPLALRIAAELAAGRPDGSLAALVAELSDRRRLGLLDPGGDPRSAVTTVFSWSVRALTEPAARTFRLLGLHPGPHFDVHAVAATARLDLAHARRILRELTRAHLIHRVGAERYGIHDLLHAYAAHLATDAGDHTGPALDRLRRHYLSMATAATDTLYPEQAVRRPRTAPPPPSAPDVTTPDAARAWLDAERASLVATVLQCAAQGRADQAVRLSSTLFRYLQGGHYTDALTVGECASDAARRAGDPAGEASAQLGIGTVYHRLGRLDEATTRLHRALTLFRDVGDLLGEARALSNLGEVEARHGFYPEAADYQLRALALHEQVGDRSGVAGALTNLGEIRERLGDFSAAAAYQQRALALFREIGEPDGEASALNGLGEASRHAGYPADAATHHSAALSVATGANLPDEQARAHAGLGRAHHDLGFAVFAWDHYQRALAGYRDLGLPQADAVHAEVATLARPAPEEPGTGENSAGENGAGGNGGSSLSAPG
ncbi:ATP-binding protein [Paractinoplanes rishiriensis]|uniref:HTH cro/C1-type domain-containing protein n=1 Tax=Paractinoplanes rishiriensis TaxID=1050105 RepID=A0A919JV83_9ACTN|nr:tetratricopeptide repeat protein [Actinoplanes rishiriensis]GIE95443.1 hypothetical protein Ari01nite_29080 [Actinoplanes rishiriensis]